MVEIVKKYETGTVVKCVHCNGTGICAHSTYTRIENTIPRQERYSGFKSCNRCGQGVLALKFERSTGFLSCVHEHRNGEPKPPACAVCGGVGSVRI